MKATELIQETVDYYSEDVSRRAVDEFGYCHYNKNGKKCAVGRCIIDELNHDFTMSWDYLHCSNVKVDSFEERQAFLKEEYRGFPDDLWNVLQRLHDINSNWIKSGLSEFGKAMVTHLMARYANITNE